MTRYIVIYYIVLFKSTIKSLFLRIPLHSFAFLYILHFAIAIVLLHELCVRLYFVVKV